MCPDACMHIIVKISTFVKLAFINIQILGILILSDNFAFTTFLDKFFILFSIFFCKLFSVFFIIREFGIYVMYGLISTMQVKASHFESFIYLNFLVLLSNPASLHECYGTIVKLFLLLF